jgi:nudix-type nucleoside diphosphatase (YffH/AdpP family)
LSAIFLHAPFDDPMVLVRIVGGEPERGDAATLAGHVLRSDEHGLRVALTPGDGGVAGRLLRLDAAGRARLDFVMAALGAEPVAVGVRAGGAEVPATAYRFVDGMAPERAPAAAPEGLGRLVETLDELMGHYGRRAPGEMPALLHGIGIRALGRSRGPERASPVSLGTPLGAGDVEIVERRHAYARYFAIEEHLLRHRRFDGGQSDMLERAIFTSGDAVVVLPYDPRRDAVLLIEQFRAGPWARRDPRPWRLETVAGRCDRNEPPEATARREAREEAGIELGRIERIAAFYPSPAIMSEFITAFVGEADLGAAGGVFGLPEEHEDIRAQVVPLAAALAAVENGEIDTAPLMLALGWLEKHGPRLRAEWR